MKRIILTLAFVAFAVLISAQQQALVAVTEFWPPYRIDIDGKLSGIDIDLIRALEDRIGIPIEVQRHPFARCLEMIRQGQADLITGIAYTPEREEYIRYSPQSYSDVRPVFYVATGKGATVQQYEDLYGLRIGYSLNSAYFEPFNSDAELTKVGLSNEEQVLRMLAFGRVDAIIGTNPNLAYDVARLGFVHRVEQTVYQPEPRTPLYFGYPRNAGRQDLFDDIDLALGQLLEEGVVESILEGYR
jgi:polar amino acid transport system substrate-binding protein